MSSSRVIDGHLHLWDPSRLHYDWVEGDDRLDRAWLPDYLDRGSSGVTDFVFVQADARVDEGLLEAQWVNSIADEWPELAAIVAFAPIELGSGVAAAIDALVEVPRVVGIRRLLQDEDAGFFERPELARGLAELARRGLSFDACVRWHQLPALARLLDTVPDLVVVLDHLGKPPIAEGAGDSFAAWKWSLERLAANPNVRLKLSGLYAECAPSGDLDAVVRPYLETGLSIFGSNRSLLGSDWPVSAVFPQPIAYDSWFSLVLDGLGMSANERDNIAWRTAATAYRIPIT